LLLVLLIIVLSIPSVQTKIANKVTEKLNATYGTDICIERMGLNWKGEVDIRNVFIRDHHKDTLIFSEFLNTNILSIKKLMDGNLDFGFVEMENAKLLVKTYKGEIDDNLYVFTEKFNTGDTTATEPFLLWSKNVSLENTEIRISDENLDSPELVNLKEVNLNADDFHVNDVIVSAKIESLSFLETSGIVVKDISGDFKYTPTQLFLERYNLTTSHSVLKGDLVLTFENGMADFVNQVNIDAHFDETIVSTDDLNVFYAEFGKDINLKIQGDFKGILNDFQFSNASLSFLNSSLKGDFEFKNLFNQEVFDINGKQHQISTNYIDLKSFMPTVIGNDLPTELKAFGLFSISGNTRLHGDELTTNSRVISALGLANTQLAMRNINDFANAFYQGNVELTKFNLGKLTGSKSLGTIDANLNFDGRGFTSKTVSTQIDGNISSFMLEGYNYQYITVSGTMKNPLFNGHLEINDPNLSMQFDGLIDVSKELNHYDFEANIEFAELNKLNLFTRDSVSVFTGDIKMDMDGTTINDVVGTIQFSKTFYQTAQKDYFFDDFNITSTFQDEERTIEVISPDIINGRIRGKFLLEDIPYLFRNAIGSIYTNYIPIQVTTDQYLNYEFEIYNKIVDVFIPQLQLGENTRLKGTVYSDESKFKLDFKSPELLLYSSYLGKVNVKLDNDNPLFNAFISVDSLYNGTYDLTNINIINKTLKDTLYIQSNFKGGKKKEDLFNLSFYHTINPEGRSVVGIKRSKITYVGNEWFLNRDNNNLNKISFDDNFNHIKLDSLTLRHDNELIQMAGFKNDSTAMEVRLQFKDVNIGNLVPKIDSLDLTGNINGNLYVRKKGKAYYPSSRMIISDLSMNKIDMGELQLLITGNSDLTQYNINSSLVNENFSSFKAIGVLEVASENPQIDMDVTFQEFNLKAFSPLGGDVISNIRGFMNGNAKVSGNYKAPNISGNLLLNKAGMKIPYLNTDFDLEDRTAIFLQKDRFNINSTTITDTKHKTQGNLVGKITHSNFSDWGLDLELTTNRLLVLDTPPDEDALYYGTAFISGNSTIKGPVEELVINVEATTEEGTTFKIPISDAASIGDDSFIRFISPEEKQARIKGETFVPEQIKGLTLNFDLDINDNAEVEILVDPVNNSKFKGRGSGLMFLEINTLGKFKMWGEFVIIEGSYDFKYGGIVNKVIDVVPGGRITWNGEPTQARLDLTAKYKVDDVNPSALLDNPSLNTTVDVEVLLNLTGEIMQPDLDFQLRFPNVSSTVREELNVKLSNKEQRQLQAIYLAATGSFQGGSNQGLAGTLTERVNKLVADIFADSDSKFKILPTIGTRQVSINDQLEYNVGVQISTKISERILVNGKVAVPVGGANESSVAGDIEVQWLVNDDGSLRINFFNRQATLQFIGEDQTFEQGAGVSYTVDFDTFKELMQKLFNKKVTLESENEIPIVPDDNDFPANLNTAANNRNEE
jgi:TamB, inner membrane protein subunit of TAM complex